MPVSSRPARYSSPGSRYQQPAGQSVVPPLKMPLLHQLLRGQSPLCGTPRGGYSCYQQGPSTPRRTNSMNARPAHRSTSNPQGTPNSHAAALHQQHQQQAERRLLTSPQTPASPRTAGAAPLSRSSGFSSSHSCLLSQSTRSPISPRYTPTSAHVPRKGSAASFEGLTAGGGHGHEDGPFSAASAHHNQQQQQQRQEPSFRSFNTPTSVGTPGGAASPLVAAGPAAGIFNPASSSTHEATTPQQQQQQHRRRALSAHAGASRAPQQQQQQQQQQGGGGGLRRGPGHGELGAMSASTSSLLKGLLDASRTLSSPRMYNSLPQTPGRSANSQTQTPPRLGSTLGTLRSPMSAGVAGGCGGAGGLGGSSYTPLNSSHSQISALSSSASWAPSPRPASIASGGGGGGGGGSAISTPLSGPARHPSAMQSPLKFQSSAHDVETTPSVAKAQSGRPSTVETSATTAVASAGGPSGRKVPSHISNMVCTWTANGQEDQSRYGENGYMRIKKGMVLDHRYHVISKLGWGEFATVWLAWDQESLRKRLTSCTSQFVAIKVSKCAEHVGNAAKEEANLLKYIGKNGRGSGMASLATVLDVFNQKGDYGNHVCMVFPVLGQNILCLVEQAHRHRSMSRGLPSLTATAKRPAEDVSFVKSCLRASLRACNELSRLNIVHTDLKPENILLTTVSQKTRETMREWQDAVAKLRGTPWEPERLVPTNEHSIDVEKEHSYIRVSDFGLSSLLDPEAKAHGIGTHARRLQTKRKGYATNPLGVILQTREYRAPEVLFGNPITPTADVWSIGCMAYELVTGTFLMDPKKDPKKRTKPEDEINMDHICMMQQIIGPVPAHVAKMGGKHLPKYFTDDGRFYQQEKADKYFPPRNLKHELCVFLTDNDSDMLCNFVNQCLGSFDTTARATAEEMLKHPFLSR